jgi:chromosome segregation ATPase
VSYSTFDVSQMEQTLKRLESRVSSLAGDVEELQGRHQSLDGQVELHDDRLDELEEAGQELREAHDELGEELRDKVAASVKALAGTVSWLERRVRAEQDISPVDLDAVDDVIRGLAERARRGLQSEAVLLSDDARVAHQHTIDRLDHLRDRIEKNTEAAVRHSTALAATAFGSDEHAQAGLGYRAAIKARAGDRAQLAAAAAAADAAREALALDDEHREVHGPQVTTGESARAQLHGRLRDRVAAMVAEGALPPAWFTTVLGYQPPADGTQAWLETATAVLMYRVTYKIIDPIVALGPAAGDTRRQAWRTEITDALRRRRRWL